MKWRHSIIMVAFLNCAVLGVKSSGCPPDKLDSCLSMAHKFLENDRFTFPTTKTDVEDVCESWSKFLECIEKYVADCLDNKQKLEFKLAVENILDSVRNLCTDEKYQQQYFKHAECIKRTCTDDAYCGKYYKQLTRQVSQDFDTNDLCCTYRQFDNCVIVNTNDICGSTARDFASAMLNKAMSFLASRCQINDRSQLENCIEIESEGSNRASQLPAGSRALPFAPTVASPTTSRWTPTKSPQSLAYGNDGSSLITSSVALITLLTLSFSIFIAFY